MASDRRGFTLIEILIVVVVIGILAAIALPKFGATREATYYSTLRSDLTNLARAQEIYYQEGRTFSYASRPDDLDNFDVSPGVTVASMRTLNGGQAWEAVLTHEGLADGACVLGYGRPGSDSWTASGGDPVVSVTAENYGVPICND
ncbi:MAG: prepilin-type N-terminal cleavage/methylation domain-containing protein [Candidatus Longimicrobiales bacterium M2_2A_002]